MNNFLKIRNEESMILAINMLRFPEDYRNKIHLFPTALNYIFAYRGSTKNTIRNSEIFFLSKNFLNIIKNEERHYRNCIDILDKNIPEFDFLNIIRQYDEIKREKMVKKENSKLKTNQIKSVYEDSQNTHNSSINKSVLKSACFLCQKYKYMTTDFVFEGICQLLLDKFPYESDTILENIEFIKSNTSYFDPEQNVTLKKVFISVWLWISEHENFNELQDRFLEEMKEMNGYCTTGHLARFINVIQGYTQDENLIVHISLFDQCNAIVKQYLSSKLLECDDEKIHNGLTDGNEFFIKFIKKTIRDVINEWIRTYGKEAFPYLSSSINKFCNIEIFKTI